MVSLSSASLGSRPRNMKTHTELKKKKKNSLQSFCNGSKINGNLHTMSFKTHTTSYFSEMQEEKF